MKKIVALLLVALSVIALAACGEKTDKNTEESKAADPTEPENELPDDDVQIVGGWTLSASPEVTETVKTVLEKATAELTGATYEPVAYVASQVVAGTNHLILCKKTPVVPNPVTVYALVTIYEDLQGNAEIIDVKDSGVSADYAAGVDGGWGETASPAVPDDAKTALASAPIDGAQYRPVALLASQVVAGMNYRLLCSVTPVTQNPQSYYAVVEVYSGVDGSADVTGVYEFE